LCPHGVGLRFPGREGQLLAWSQVRDIGVFPVASGSRSPAVVAALLVANADQIGMPSVRRLVNARALPEDPDWVWLGRVPAARTAALTATIAGWRGEAAA
jgi:hypothetical protein